MTTGAATRVFLARLAGIGVFDPNGDQVGKVRDAIVVLRIGANPPRLTGLVVEVQPRRKIFVPDDQGHRDRRRTGHRDRHRQPAPLRAAQQRDPRHRRAARPHGRPPRDRRARVAHGRRGREVADPRLVRHPAVRPQARRRPAAPRRDLRRRLGGRHRPVAPDRRPAGRAAARPARHDALRRRRPRPAGPLPEAPARGGAQPRRRAARRRPRGAPRRRQRRDHAGPRGRARRRRPRGDGSRRRRRPAVRAAARPGRGPARAHGAGRRRGHPPTARLRRAVRRRHDDDGADRPAPGRDRRRRTRPHPQPRPLARAGLAGLRLASPDRDARPAATSAPATSSSCCASRRAPSSRRWSTST